MNIFAIYHGGLFGSSAPAPGLTTVRRGRHSLSACDVVTDGELMCAVSGRMTNESELARDAAASMGSPERLVMAAYRRWGDDYPAHIRGPISTMVFDRSADKLVASRDCMGARRLFYARKGRGAVVCDHPDPIIDTPFASRAIDVNGVNELFAIGPARTPGMTPYRDVMALEPGCALIVDRGGILVRRYFRLEPRPHEDGAEASVEKVRELLGEAVEAAVRISGSVMLSGGLDSTALAAMMCARGAKLSSFSVDYENDERDFSGNSFQPERDREFARAAAELYAQTHNEVILTAEDLVDSLVAAVDARGFPGMADVDSSLLLFADRISSSAGAVVSGECADEVFCGYPWFAGDYAQGEHFPWSGSVDMRRILLRSDVAELAKPDRYAREAFIGALECAPRLNGENVKDAALRAMQYVCLRFFMANLQERAVCMCESAAMEVVTPFCDEKLVEYVWNAPRDIKFMNGENKGLLRAAVSDLLPEKLLHRRKSPYPKTYSREYTSLIKSRVGELLETRDAPVFGIVERRVLAQLNESELPAGGLPWFGQLMSGPQMLAYIWQVNEWMRKRRIEVKL